MLLDIFLPELGENIAAGTVTKVLVKAGDALKKGQNILELETDKAVLEVPSQHNGVIKEILVKAGATVKVGQPVFRIQQDELLTSPVIPAKAGIQKDGPPIKTFGGDKIESQTPTAAPVATSAPQTPFYMPVRKDVHAAPSVRLFAREIGIDIAQVPGTGSGGRISTDDVKAYAKRIITGGAAGPTAQPSLPNFSKWGNVKREAMNNVRRKTAEHLSHAWQAIPHVTQFDKADITELEQLRKDLAGEGKKLSVTPFLVKVTAAALKRFPQFNASIDMAAHEIVYKDYCNIGVAVDTDRGLLVPVIKNADQKTVLQISDELTVLAERARARKTTIEEMQGGCFSISNLGGIGGTFFAPIVNWPEVAILGVSRGVMEQVYAEDQFVARLMLPLSLSYDHRVIDGADGARFIRFIAEALQNPGAI
ncbi:MAG: 2-oxo acid dehydrogenase subunit E2 [Candidatus Omnitrophota bacterium]|nr:2-oxo acid dehydrogenase subunit E2 [Candidatus Omnitrophota bacterium]